MNLWKWICINGLQALCWPNPKSSCLKRQTTPGLCVANQSGSRFAIVCLARMCTNIVRVVYNLSISNRFERVYLF